MNKKRAPASPAQAHGNVAAFLEVLALVMSRVGVVGFVVIVSTVVLFWFSDDAQKHQVVDTWFLFKNDGHVVCTIIVAALLFLLVVQQLHYARVNKLNSDRLKEMAAEKTWLQEKLAGGRMRSSDYDNKP